MSVATAIELFNNPILKPTKQSNADKNHNKNTISNTNHDKSITNIDEIHRNAIFGTIASENKNNPDADKQSEFDISTGLWAHNEKLLNVLNSINNRILNAASININSHAFFKAIYHYLCNYDTQRYDISIGLAIMKLLYNVSDMFPHTILYIISNKIPLIILKILKAGFKSYNPDEFSLHIEYINVLEYISRYAYQHALVINNENSNNHHSHHGHDDDDYYLHDQDAQTSKKVISHLMDMTLDDHNQNGLIDCVLSNVSLHDRKDVIKAVSILAQIFACCLYNNSSCPTYLKLDSRKDAAVAAETERERLHEMDMIQQGMKSMEQQLHEMHEKAKTNLTEFDESTLAPFQSKLNELKSQIDKQLKKRRERQMEGVEMDSDDSDVEEDEDINMEVSREKNRNLNVVFMSVECKRNKILKCLSLEVAHHCDYITSILKHNFSEIEMVDNILCFLCNFTQILLVHNAFDELITVYSETFVKDLMQFCLRCYNGIIRYQSLANAMNIDDEDGDGDNSDNEDNKDEFIGADTQPISDANNAKYCQFVVIVLRILHQLLHIDIHIIDSGKDKEEGQDKNKNNKKWQQIASIQHHVMYSCHIERLYSDLVIVHNTNNKKLNIIRLNDTSLLETIIVLGQTLNNKLSDVSVADNKLIRNNLINNLICILVEYGRNIDCTCINLILHSLNMLLTENLLTMSQHKSNHEFLNGIYQRNNEKICELISFILEKNHEANHLNIILLKHVLQIFLDWYDFTKMLKQNDKIMQIKQNLKKYGADLMINHWRKLLKETYPNYSDNNNNKEIKQVKNVMNIIKKCRRILNLDEMDEDDSDCDCDIDTESELDEDDNDIAVDHKNKKIKIFDMDEIDVMADGIYCDYVTLHLEELLLSTEVTTADHLKKVGEMLLDMTRTDNRICHKLAIGSVSCAENSKLFSHKKQDKYAKYWRLYSLHIQSIIEDRDIYNHFRILLAMKCLLNEKYLTKYQFISSGIIDILLYYLTVTENDFASIKRYKKSDTQKQKGRNSNKIKMDLLHDRQRLFAFVFFFDLDEDCLQIHLCHPSMYHKIIKYKNKFNTNINNINVNKNSQSMKYLIHLLLQCLNMDIFPIRTIKTRQNNNPNDTEEDEEDIVMNNDNNNKKKQFSFGAGAKSQEIDKYYYELKLLSERVLMINVFHDIDNCVVAQSLRFNYKHQLIEWETKQKLRQEQQLKLRKKYEESLRQKYEQSLQEKEKKETVDSDDDDEIMQDDNFYNNLSFPTIPDRQKQKVNLPRESSWGASSTTSSSLPSFDAVDAAPYNPIRAVNFSVTGHLFMTISDITKVFITKYEALRKYKYKNPFHLLTDIGINKIDKKQTDCIDLSSFLIHQCSNNHILAHFLDKNNQNGDGDEDIASIRASQLLQNGLELVVTYNGIELPKHLTVLQVLLTFDYPHLFNDYANNTNTNHTNSKSIEDITEIRHIDREEEDEFSYRTSYSKRDRHVFNIYFRWKQQNRIKPTHSNKNTNINDTDIKLPDLINPTRYLDNISYRTPTLLPAIPLHTHRTRSSSRRQTVASTSSLLLNSPPNSPINEAMRKKIKRSRRGKKRKFDKMEADHTVNSVRMTAKKRKIGYNVADYTRFYRHGMGTISVPMALNKNSTCDDLRQQHFPEIAAKWYSSIRTERIKVCKHSKWKTDGPTLIILKLLNYFHGFSSHWTSLYYDDFYDVENVFNFNQQFDINRVKMKYVYNDRNNEDDEKFASKDDIQCLLKPHIFYNKQLIERLKNQIQQSLVVMSNTTNNWIKEIPLKYPFLFPYHIRKDIFDIFSFGPSRTFKNLIQFLKKCHHNTQDSVHLEQNNNVQSVSTFNLQTSNRMRQTNILNIPSMSPLFNTNNHNNTNNDDDFKQITSQIHKNSSTHTFSMIHSMLTNDNCMIPKETHKTIKIYRKSVLSDVCALFYASKYFSPLLSYYQFQTFRYHTSQAMPADTFRDELALHLLPDPERISSIAISRPRHNHRRTINFNQTNNSNNNNVLSHGQSHSESESPKLSLKKIKKKRKKADITVPSAKKKKKIANETQLQYLPILSEGVVDFNYDNDPFSTHFSESILRAQFYGDDGVGSGPTMEFFTLATNGLDRQDLQLWIDDDTHLTNTTKHCNDTVITDDEGIDDDKLYAFGVYRCNDCTLINGMLCCAVHRDKPLTCYKNENVRGNVGIQSCVNELFYCTETECDYHCHSEVNNAAKQHDLCTFCGHKCDIYFWIISHKSIVRLNESYPLGINCISHPLMQCDCCKIISFPSCNARQLLMYSYGGVYDIDGRSYPIHYLSSAVCFNQHCHPFCYRSDINMIPILLTKAFVARLYGHIITDKDIKCLDLSHYQNIVSLSSGKSRKMRISGTKTFLTGDRASKCKSKDSLVNFICAQHAESAQHENTNKNEKESSDASDNNKVVIRNHMSHVTGYNGLFYRPNMLSFVCNSPLDSNPSKYLDVLGKIMILAVKENKRINLELHQMFFKMVLGANLRRDVTILDMLKIYPNDHYLMILFRLFNILQLYRHMGCYCAFFRDVNVSNKMEIEQDNESDGAGSDEYTFQCILSLKNKCESFIDLLCLTLNTPTFNVNLSKEKAEEMLDINNLEKYLVGICNYFLNDGISESNNYVQLGLKSMMRDDDNMDVGNDENNVLLLPFYDYEFETLVIGSNTQHFNEWTAKYLCKYVKLEQYSYNTPVIKNLYDMLCNEFDIKQKRQFIRFLTGSLSLPLGGISKLNPQFTITKFATVEQQFLYENAEYESLPHATTCRHTLRLPPYKTKTTLKSKLLQAMNHAQTGFYLS